jgi:hypothetical protein
VKGVIQDKETGCVQACVASLFEISLSEVPFFNPECWEQELQEWLEPMGLTTINMTFPQERLFDIDLPFGYTLAAIPAKHPGFPPDWKHCVICYNGHIVWCPLFGEQNGTERAQEYTIIYPLTLAGIGGPQ